MSAIGQRRAEKGQESGRALKVGARLKFARRIKGLRLHQLAERVGCSEGFLSKIENDKVNPSLQMLHRIVTSLNISIGQILAEDIDEHTVVMRSGERPTIRMVPDRETEGIHLEWLIPPGDARMLSGSIHVVHPGGRTHGVIKHEGEEVGYVLEGELELEVDGETLHLKAGDSFFFDSNKPHGYRNKGENVTRVLWVNTPPTF